MRDAPPHEWDPEVWDEERDEQYGIDVVVELLRRAENHDAFVTDDQNDHRGHDVEEYSVCCCSGSPTERYGT